MNLFSDPHFRVEVMNQTSNPQQLIWRNMHQCVSSEAAYDEPCPDEAEAGRAVVKHLLAGNRGHYSPLEAPQINLNIIGFNHATMGQVRTHRVGWHYSVQSFRYTGDKVYELGKWWYDFELTSDFALESAVLKEVNKVFYLRPVGQYLDREGRKYEYTLGQRIDDAYDAVNLACKYYKRINQGFAPEHSRGMIPFDVRQNWGTSANVRSLMHLLDLRWAKGAQLECQVLCDLIWPHFESWVPEIAEWYNKNRAKKARLAP